jgi:hypothetical protein
MGWAPGLSRRYGVTAMPTTSRRLLTLLLLSATVLLLTAAPALAHGRGSDASNYESTITADPGVEGLTWRIINSDEYLQLDNDGDAEVAVPGYSGEPYLRIGPDGVFRNRNSQATYVNEDRFGDTVIPSDIDPGGPPDWEQVSGGSSYAWHDHRIHWMASTDPPGVQTDPGSEQLVNSWTVPFEVDGSEHELAGELVWVPGGSPWAWLIPALVIVSAPVAYGLLRTEPDVEAVRWPGLSRLAGGTLLIIAVANVFHLVDDLFATPIPISETAVSAIQTAFFIAIAIFGAVRAMQGHEGAFTALGVGAGAVFIGQGLLYFSVLGASQTASLFPGWLTRAIIALSVAQIVPMGIAAVVGTRRLLPEWDDDDLAQEAVTPA